MTAVTACFDYSHSITPVLKSNLLMLKKCCMNLVATPPACENDELVRIFRQMASCYRYMGKEERFRALAYDNAARTIANLDEDIAVYAKDTGTLDKLSGIGESIAEKIIEYLKTGKIKTHEKLKHQVPVELLELMDINGLGPATIKTLHEKLGINNRDELAKALKGEKITSLKGFGAKKLENMKRGMKLYKESHTRMLLPDAMQIGNEILAGVKNIPGIKKAALAGSIRRRKDTIGDIDMIITADEKNWKKILAKFIRLPQVNRVLVSGNTKASVLLKINNIQVDVRVVHDHEYGAAMLYFTGSREHTIQLRTIAKQRGYKINEYGLFDTITGKRLAGDTEESMYKVLGLKYIPPEKRLGAGEIEKAMIK
jgi:DNA polymerase (family 10)